MFTEGRGQTHDYLHGEHVIFGQSLQWIITSTHKYVWWSQEGTEQLFNRQADPDEQCDLLRAERLTQLSEDDTNALLTCRRHLIDKLDGREEGFVRQGALVPGRPVSAVLSKKA